MNNGYACFLDQLDQAIAAYPTLRKVGVDDRVVLAGCLPVIDRDGRLWEEYEVEIHASEQFPHRFPYLYETGGKIPRIGDWHVNEDTFTCCTTIPAEEILRCKKGITVTEYIDEQVMPYLFNQTHRRVEGYYVNGEYAHGVKGLLEYYSHVLGTDGSPGVTVRQLLYIAENTCPPRTSYCFCGSGLKYRHCHKKAFQMLQEVGVEILRMNALMIGRRYGVL
ncbi:SEC-C domain-containing protein [Chitinophaga sp. S165]|uniref:SEC-C domain-containing protein n=1 Tax=Chitinophaga sp. S165 TaxID=2135462 RepID=UPI000D718E61|nr:SEC-C domain-containing protein [Chitinophaga sp. S165]